MSQSTDVLNAASKVFNKLHEFGYNDFILAGGAPRDLLLNRQVTDLDFIVKRTKFNESKILNEWKGSYLKKPDMYGNWQSSTQSFEVIESEDKLLQFMLVECTPQEFVNHTFDIGLCQIAFAPEDKILASDAFMADVYDAKLTVLSRSSLTVWQAGVSIQRHAPKLQKKYHWPIRVHCYPDEDPGPFARKYPSHYLRPLTRAEISLCQTTA